MRMTASYRQASGCIQRRNRQQEGRRNIRFWYLGAHSDETAKKRSEVAVARRPPMVSAPGKRMGCCCFGASPSMRIVASTVYKDVAIGFYNHRQLEAGSASCRFVVFKSSDRPPPPDSWGRSASADHHQSPIRMAKEAP